MKGPFRGEGRVTVGSRIKVEGVDDNADKVRRREGRPRNKFGGSNGDSEPSLASESNLGEG